MQSEDLRVGTKHQFFENGVLIHEEIQEVRHLGHRITIKDKDYRISHWFSSDVIKVHVFSN